MEKKVNNKFTIFKLSLLITFLLTMIVTTVIMGNRSAVNAATAYDDNGIRWTFNYNNSTMEITNIYTTSLTAEQAENLVIPATLMYGGSEYTVRSIGYGSSYSSYQFPKTIKNLTIPDTVTTINNYAFTNQTQLEHVTWGTGITSIGSYAFYYCYNLEGDLPLREGMTTLGTSAFHYCNKLSGELIFPESLTSVASNSFYGCSSITGIKFGDNIPLQVITNIYGYEKFQTLELYDNSELYKMEDGVLFSKDGKRLYLSAKTDYNNYVVPSDVTSIEPSAFRYAKSMTGTLTLNEGLLSIGNYAFSGQKDLTGHLRIPDSVTTIGSQAFYDCPNFDRVTIGAGITM